MQNRHTMQSSKRKLFSAFAILKVNELIFQWMGDSFEFTCRALFYIKQVQSWIIHVFFHFFQCLVNLEGKKPEFIPQALSLYCWNGNIALIIIVLLITLICLIIIRRILFKSSLLFDTAAKLRIISRKEVKSICVILSPILYQVPMRFFWKESSVSFT